MSRDTKIIIAVIRTVGYFLLMTILDGRGSVKKGAARDYERGVDEAIREAGGEP